MAKLQKSLKQQQRYSLQAQKTVSRLTPEEIRMLNGNVDSIGGGHNRSLITSVQSSYHDLATPPLTPDRANNPSQNAKSGLPTPPQSPYMVDEYPRDFSLSYEATFARPQVHGTDPESRTPSQPTTSRTSSVDSTKNSLSSREGEQENTDRMTRHEAFPKIPAPIPFAQFSRLGRSHGILSGDQQTEATHGQTHSPQRPSADEHDRSIPSTALSAGQAQDSETAESPPSTTTVNARAAIDAAKTKPFLGPRDLLLLQSEEQTQPTDVKSPVAPTREVKSKTPSASYQLRPEWEHPKIKNARRATMSATKPLDFVTVPYTQTASGTKPKMKESLKEDLPSAKASTLHSKNQASRQAPDMSIHPALRPQGPQPPVDDPLQLVMNDKTKPLDSQAPVYSRCNHCGKLKKVLAFQNELQSVPEAEGTLTSPNTCKPITQRLPSNDKWDSNTARSIDRPVGQTVLECHGPHHDEGAGQLDNGDVHTPPLAVQPVSVQTPLPLNMPMTLQTPVHRLRTRGVVRFPSLHFNAGLEDDAEKMEESSGDWNTLLDTAGTKSLPATISHGAERNPNTLTTSTQSQRHVPNHKRAPSLPVHNIHPFNSASGRQEGRGRTLQRPTPIISQKPDKQPSSNRVRFDNELTMYKDNEFAVLLPGGHRRTESQPLSNGQSAAQTITTIESKPRTQHYIISGVNGAKSGGRGRRSSLAIVQLSPEADDESSRTYSQTGEQDVFKAQNRGSLTAPPATMPPKKKRTSSASRTSFAMVAAVRDYVRPRTDRSPRPPKTESDQSDHSLNISRSNPRSRESTSRAREQSLSRIQNRQRSYASAEIINSSMADIFVPPNPPFLADAQLKT